MKTLKPKDIQKIIKDITPKLLSKESLESIKNINKELEEFREDWKRSQTFTVEDWFKIIGVKL